jgi:leucyl aminopeptidase
MNVSVTQKRPEKLTGTLLCFSLAEKDGLTGPAVMYDKSVRGVVSQMIARRKMKGKSGETLVSHPAGKTGPDTLLVQGVGMMPMSGKDLRKFAAKAVREAGANKLKKVVLLVPPCAEGDEAAMVQAVAEGAILGGYVFDRYKSSEGEKPAKVSTVMIVLDKDADLTAAKKGLRIGKLFSEGTMVARELVNEPASEMTPIKLVEAAKSVAEASPDHVSIKLMNRAKLKNMGAGGLLAVAQGSDEEPYMIHLTYKPKGKAKSRIAFIGKGLTFDSGGLSLKPSQGMEDMKIDMAGAAAVIGAFSVLSEMKPDVEVHGIIGACENMPSGRAVKPGDIVTTMNGKTVEILNTDAEGRVTMADTLHYGAQLEPDFMVDLATLTGACMVALGQEVAGLMSNSDGLAESLLKASDSSGELIWRLPLTEEYEESMKSPVADLKNISGTRYGGAITAGLFLKQFVGETAWAHIDIAGPSWAEKDTVPYQPRGATGFGVRTMLSFIQNQLGN